MINEVDTTPPWGGNGLHDPSSLLFSECGCGKW